MKHTKYSAQARRAGILRWSALAMILLSALASASTREIFAAELEIRVADEVAPAGGLALIRIELTEPKPVSGGQMRFFLDSAFLAPLAPVEATTGPLGPIMAAGFLSRTGDVTGDVFLGTNDATFQFTSPQSSFGMQDDLPIMVIAIPVHPSAVPGTSVSLRLDLGAIRFLDPNGVPYTVGVKPGRFTVGGVSINKIVAPGWSVPAGSDIILNGVGFQQGARADIEGADLSATRVVSAQRIEVTARAAFGLGNARVRVRNPDNSEEFFYAIPALVESDQNQNVTVRFSLAGLSLLSGQSRKITVQLSPAPAEDGALQLQSSDPTVLLAPVSVPVPSKSSSAAFSVFGMKAGTAGLTASMSGPAGSLSVSVAEGTLLQIPVLRNDASSSLGMAIANHEESIANLEVRGFPLGAAGGPPQDPIVVPLSLAPMRQTSRFLTEFDPRFQGFRGWLEVGSGSRGVHALFLNMPADPVAFAGSSGSSPAASDIIFPRSTLDPEGSLEVALINNNFREALLSLDLTSSAGGLLRRVQRILAPQESLITSLRTLFPDDAGFLPDRYIRARSSQPLIAYQQTSGAGRIFAHSPPTPERASGRLYLPQFASGAGWFTEISLVNAGATEAVVLMRLLDDRGGEIIPDVQVNPARLTIQPGGMRVMQGKDLFGITGAGLVVGSIIVESDAVVVGSALVGESGRKQVLTGVPVLPQLLSEAVFPHLATGTVGGISYFTGIALQNANREAADVLIRVYSSSGGLRGETSVALPGGGRISKLLTELVPGLEGLVGGHVHIVSTRPIGMIQIYGNDNLEFITAVPPSVIR